MNQLDLAGRHAVITGGAAGLGLAITQRMLASGATVTWWDSDSHCCQAFSLSLFPAANLAGWGKGHFYNYSNRMFVVVGRHGPAPTPPLRARAPTSKR